jgi:Piwi domain
MVDDYKIHLNFLAVQNPLPSFTTFRKRRDLSKNDRPDDLVSAYKLPNTRGDKEDWLAFWISPNPRSDFESFEVEAELNRELTKWFLFLGLRKAAAARLKDDQLHVPDKSFIEEVSFVMVRHEEGEETLVIQPYYLKAENRFGLLADFHFRLAKGVPFSRRVQQLSLSVDHSGRRNLDCYVDRIAKIKTFVDQRWDVLSSIQIPGASEPLTIVKDFFPVRAGRLRSRVYVFAGERESKSQFAGLKQHGPLKGLEASPKLLFVFREQDRQAARILATSLRGAKGNERFAFPGFKSLFKIDLDIDHDPVVVTDFSEAELEKALSRAKRERQTHDALIPVIVLPDGEDEGYLRQKAMFVHSEIPTQVCTLRLLRDPDMLKWAIGNLALQVFCKAGGQPWKVRPAPAERSLIIGISQSHKLKLEGERRSVEKYFAFSVLTDSSGLFHDIQVLGESENQDEYLSRLRSSLNKILAESAESFGRVVVHTSFKLRHNEMKAIEDVVRHAASDKTSCRFAVIKVNHRCRFFGVNRSVNSLVPYEATQLRLGPGEYLVWFEGIFPDNPTVNKAFPGPTHLQFLRVNKENAISPDVLLQDLINLSGANWRGFNAKSAPVSVFYCHLIADLVRNFHKQGLPMPAVKDIRPWFL